MRIKSAILLGLTLFGFGVMADGASASTHHHARHHHHHRGHGRHHRHSRAHFPQVSQATRSHVAALIKAQAPHYGVPAWFALKIAKVESGYNPLVTGSEGEIGVFQLKCQTARGIGYSGSCKGLYDPSTNIRWGLRHLSMAVRAAHGNLRLAASMHNGGLGCRHIVRSYVAMVF